MQGSDGKGVYVPWHLSNAALLLWMSADYVGEQMDVSSQILAPSLLSPYFCHVEKMLLCNCSAFSSSPIYEHRPLLFLNQTAQEQNCRLLKSKMQLTKPRKSRTDHYGNSQN